MAKNEVRTITLKVSDNTKEKMIEYFADKKRDVTPPYTVFQAKEADTMVTLYESGKAVFQGISADIDANMWMEMEKHLNPNKKLEVKKVDNNPKSKNNRRIVDNKLYHCTSIGSDEVGTGDYFGPIVVTATYVTKKDIPFLEQLGVRDSKKITDEHILKVVPEIIKQIPYSSMILSNEEYNHKYSDKINLNTIKAILHNKVLLDMSKQYKKHDYIVVDQFTEPFSSETAHYLARRILTKAPHTIYFRRSGCLQGWLKAGRRTEFLYPCTAAQKSAPPFRRSEL